MGYEGPLETEQQSPETRAEGFTLQSGLVVSGRCGRYLVTSREYGEVSMCGKDGVLLLR